MCCYVGSEVGTTLGKKVNALYVWTWGTLVGTMVGIGVGSET